MTSADSSATLLADGSARWWRSPDGVATRCRIENEVRCRYREEFQRSRWLRRILLEFRMQKEIAAERVKVVPPETLWIAWR